MTDTEASTLITYATTTISNFHENQNLAVQFLCLK